MVKKTIKVDGMTCEHCVEVVQKAVNEVSGVECIDINLNAKQVSVSYDDGKANLNVIFEKIKEAGFEISD
tara:strand:+ start:238 stop:447 length:210 start_codon:yes stop_codon:yes gene_type:complete